MKCSYISVIIVVAAAMIGCTSGRNDSGREGHLKVAVSIPPLQSLVEAIAGDSIEVVTVAGNDVNPETFEMTLAAHRNLADADMYISLNAFPFEGSIAANLPQTVDIIDASAEIPRLYGTHSHDNGVEEHKGHHGCHHPGHHHEDGDNEGEADPHVWTSVKNMRQMAVMVAGALAKAAPGRADYFHQRLKDYCEHLDSIDASIAEKLNIAGSPSFLIWHPSLAYYANDYGIEQIAVGAENKELSIIQLRERIKKAKDSNVGVLLLQSNFDSSQASNIMKEVKVDTLSINLLSADWLSQLNAITDAICGK